MPSFSLYTYRNITELRQIQAENNVYSFVFGDTDELLQRSPAIFLDISALVYSLHTNKSNIYTANYNLSEMTDETKIIIEESLAEEALSIFPFLFSCHQPLLEPIDPVGEEQNCNVIPYPRQSIYVYNNTNDLNVIIKYANLKNIPFATFPQAKENFQSAFEKINKSQELALLDLTSVSYTLEDNKNLIYVVELFLTNFPNIKVIALTSQVDTITKYFPLYIEGQKPINELLPEAELPNLKSMETRETKRMTQLSATEFDEFMQKFNHNLVGHCYFKERLKHSLKNFIKLNKAKEQKVLSVFLYGKSGIGKTEVARLIANGLEEDTYLAKINFQNYSSQDALNSLIGSPAGYIGCDHGELGDKVKKSQVGVVLCDEFDKTTRPVFLYFLELLEEGRFTDSLAREYDVDGYVLVFTSNIQTEAEYKKTIPPELQTRFDLVCEFEEPTPNEKREFLDLLLERAKEKYAEQFIKANMTSEEKEKLYDFDYSSLSALRDIKRIFNNQLMDFFDAKGV